MKYQQLLNNFVNRWSRPIADKGFTMVPNCLTQCKSSLNITDSEYAVLMCIITYRYKKSDPFPAVGTIAKHISKSHQAVRTALRGLEDKGLIKRDYRIGDTTLYDLKPLIIKLENHECINPIQKRIGIYPKTRTLVYPFSSTKEEQLKRKLNKNGVQSIAEILKQRGPP